MKALAWIFHQVAPVDESFPSQNSQVHGTNRKANLDRRGYAGLRGACAALLRSSARECTKESLGRAFVCAPLAQHRSPLHPRNARVPDEISGLGLGALRVLWVVARLALIPVVWGGRHGQD